MTDIHITSALIRNTNKCHGGGGNVCGGSGETALNIERTEEKKTAVERSGNTFWKMKSRWKNGN